MTTHQISWMQNGQKNALKLVWITDTHMDAANQSAQAAFLDRLVASKPDLLLVGGDLCNGIPCVQTLQVLQKAVQVPLYFVLGNHDYYYSSIAKTRQQASDLHINNAQITYLSEGNLIPLTADTALIGHDGWSDGQAGDFLASSIQLNDYFLIEELRHITPKERLKRLQALGAEAAASLQKTLRAAFDRYQRVIILTHVPPFREACLYKGKPTDDDWAPHFVGQTTGEMLHEVSKQYPDKEILVLCGHTHSPADLFITPQIRVVAGESELGSPSIQGLILVN